jgi:TetR/AcrR family transcriptional regulator, ethionamide resistance regulator
MASPRLRKRQRENRENTRREILAAVDRFLRERPYRELSVDVVMAQIGLTRTAFYRHFDDLPDVLLRLLAEVGAELYVIGDDWRARAGLDYPLAAHEALAAVVDFFTRHGPLVRAFAEAASTDEKIEQGYEAFADTFTKMIAQGLDTLVERGQLQVPDTASLALALSLMNEAYLLHEFGHEQRGDPEVVLATLETIWLRVAGPRPPGEGGGGGGAAEQASAAADQASAGADQGSARAAADPSSAGAAPD